MPPEFVFKVRKMLSKLHSCITDRCGSSVIISALGQAKAGKLRFQSQTELLTQYAVSRQERNLWAGMRFINVQA